LVQPGTIFRPRHLLAGFWLQVDDFASCPMWESLLPLVTSPSYEIASDIGPSMQIYRQRENAKRAKGMFLFASNGSGM